MLLFKKKGVIFILYHLPDVRQGGGGAGGKSPVPSVPAIFIHIFCLDHQHPHPRLGGYG